MAPLAKPHRSHNGIFPRLSTKFPQFFWWPPRNFVQRSLPPRYRPGTPPGSTTRYTSKVLGLAPPQTASVCIGERDGVEFKGRVSRLGRRSAHGRCPWSAASPRVKTPRCARTRKRRGRMYRFAEALPAPSSWSSQHVYGQCQPRAGKQASVGW